MQLVLSGNNHFKLTDTLRLYTEEKLERIKRHANGHSVININIAFDIVNLDHIATANVLIAGKTIQAHAASQESMYSAIDTLADKLDRQIKKHREKQTAHHRE